MTGLTIMVKLRIKEAFFLKCIYLLLFILSCFLSCVCSLPVTFRVVLPNNIPLVKEMRTQFKAISYGILERGPDHRGLVKRGYELKAGYQVLNNSSPSEILNFFCNDIFRNKVNTLVYIKANSGTKVEITRDFIMDIAASVKLPVISWDPDYPGALQVRLIFYFL